MNALSKIAILDAQLGANDPADQYFCAAYLHSVNVITADDIPIIATTGDTLTVDMERGLVLLNGDSLSRITYETESGRVPMNALVDFNAAFFALNAGSNVVNIGSDATVAGTVYVPKRWL